MKLNIKNKIVWDKAWAILSIIFIGVLPIGLAALTILFMFNINIGILEDFIINHPIILICFIILSAHKRYCIYHQIMTIGLLLMSINDYMYFRYPDYIHEINIVQMTFMVITIYGITITVIHLLKQTKLHINKLIILKYALGKRK
ncbi:MAG: hypothetical protein RR513_09355 [Muribaculaceae bacterium]